MVDDAGPVPTHEWATHSAPDFLALQVPPVPIVADDGAAHDAFKALLARRGFTAVTRDDDLGLGASSGCLLTRTGPASLELLVTVGPRVGATRLPLTGLDPAWVERVAAAGHVPVLVVDAAVRPDGTTDRDALRADVEAGGVLGALVPTSATDD